MQDTVLITKNIFDTIYINKSVVNNFFDSFLTSIDLKTIVSSMFGFISAVVMFFVYFYKDLLFFNKNLKTSKESFKFEKAHPKRVDLIEKLIAEVYDMHSDLTTYYNLYKHLDALQQKEYFNQKFQKFSIIVALAGPISLYFDDEYVKIVSDLTDDMIAQFFMFHGLGREGDKNFEYYTEKINTLLGELKQMSKIILNENIC